MVRVASQAHGPRQRREILVRPLSRPAGLVHVPLLPQILGHLDHEIGHNTGADDEAKPHPEHSRVTE